MIDITLGDIERWICEHEPRFAKWPKGRLLETLEWWSNHGSLGIVHDQGELVAVGAGYPCSWEELGRSWIVPNPSGPCMYVEMLLSTRPLASVGLFKIMSTLWPQWSTLILVGRRHGKMRIITRARLANWFRQLARKSHDSRCTRAA
jgi:hypothetical protein